MCRNTPDALARPGFAPAQALNAHRIGLRQNIRRADVYKRQGPFDPVKLLPLTYVVAGAFILMSVVLIIADVVKPITLF